MNYLLLPRKPSKGNPHTLYELFNLLKKSWLGHWESILIANNTRPPMRLRVNLTKISCEIYLEMLDQKIPLPSLSIFCPRLFN